MTLHGRGGPNVRPRAPGDHQTRVTEPGLILAREPPTATQRTHAGQRHPQQTRSTPARRAARRTGGRSSGRLGPQPPARGYVRVGATTRGLGRNHTPTAGSQARRRLRPQSPLLLRRARPGDGSAVLLRALTRRNPPPSNAPENRSRSRPLAWGLGAAPALLGRYRGALAVESRQPMLTRAFRDP